MLYYSITGLLVGGAIGMMFAIAYSKIKFHKNIWDY